MIANFDAISDLSPSRDAANPTFLWATDGQLIWANAAAAVYWGVSSRQALLAVDFSKHPVQPQILQALRALPRDATRLERLRLAPFGRLALLTARVRHMALPDGADALLVIALDKVPIEKIAAVSMADRATRPADATIPASEAASPPSHAPFQPIAARDQAPSGDPMAHARPGIVATALGVVAAAKAVAEALDHGGDAAPAPAEPDRRVMADLPSSVVTPAPAPPARMAEPTHAPTPIAQSERAAAILARLARPLRFVWESDPSGRLTYVSREFVGAVGAEAMPGDEERFAAFARRHQADSLGKLEAALASRAPWSEVTLLWPIAESAERAEVELTAAPMEGPDGFLGYRGFGLVRALTSSTASPSPTEPGPSAPTVVDNVLPFPGNGNGTERKLEPEDAAALRTIARVLGGPIGVPSETSGADAEPPDPSSLPCSVAAIAAEYERAAAEEPRSPEAPEPAPAGSDTATEAAPHEEQLAAQEAPVEVEPEPAVPDIGARSLGEVVRQLLGTAGPDSVAASEAPDGKVDDATRTHSVADVVAELARLGEAEHAEEDAPPTAPLASVREEPTPDIQPPPRIAAEQTQDPAAEILVLQAALDLSRAREAELSSILDTATDGVIVLAADGRILSLNRAAEALFGIEGDEVAGLPLIHLLAPESHRLASDYLDGLVHNGVASVLNDGREVVGLEKKGGRIPLFMTMGRVSVEPAAEKFCAVLRDITHWKTVERDLIDAKREAERASQHKSEFLAKISHEIRTPLNAIIGFSEMMMQERFGMLQNERYRGYIADIHSAGEHLMGLVNDLLDLSKIEAGKLELTFSAVKLADIVQQAVTAMQPQANRDGVILRTSLLHVPPVIADARSLRQILFNLLSNAIKFTRAGGQVIVSTGATDEGEVTLRVRDTGIGMSEREISTALEPFRQISVSNRAEVDGTGLGLPLTKALAEANRASFAIESAPDVGTLVQITFPATRVLAK